MSIHYIRPNLRPGLQSEDALSVLLRGIETMAAPIALTMGPARGAILNDLGNDPPEFLTDSSTIARRVIEIPVRAENVGAMMLRTMVWNIHEEFGDGAAIATVITRAMVREATRLIAAGYNPALLRSGIEQGLELAKKALDEQTQPLDDQESIARLAIGITGDIELGTLLGEMYDVLGENAAIITEDIQTPYLNREYVKGGIWDGVPASRILLPEGSGALELANPLVAIVNDDLKTLDQVQPLLEIAVTTEGKPPLVLIAKSFSDEVINILNVNHLRGILTIGAVTLSTGLTLLEDVFEDLAIITGGQVFAPILGRPTQQARPEHLGRVRKATISRRNIVLVDGAGDQKQIRKRINDIRAQIANMKRGEDDWQHCRVRIGRLAGGIGILKIGAFTEQEREQKKERTQKALLVLERAIEDGVVSGGGVAYLNCIPAVATGQQACQSQDEAAGMSILIKGLEAPFKQIVYNHGEIHPPIALAKVRELGATYGFDITTGTYVDMFENGIVDSVNTLRNVLNAAASLAAMVITTEAIVFGGDK